MLIEAKNDAMTVKLGRRFDLAEARRLADAATAFGPCSEFRVDFSDVRESDDAALSSLAEVLLSVPEGRFELRGITMHQARVLKYLGADRTRARAVAQESIAPQPVAFAVAPEGAVEGFAARAVP
jgi:hypothetical protein